MNNQFSGPNAWCDYLTALERATPIIEAIAVTDYYVTDTYEEVLRRKAAGRLPGAKLIFPNVELRLDVATTRGGFVNLHLFVSPEDPQHIKELRRLLSRLQFNVMRDRFDCTRAELIRLGKKRPPTHRLQQLPESALPEVPGGSGTRVARRTRGRPAASRLFPRGLHGARRGR
jgi:hypothetical protein